MIKETKYTHHEPDVDPSLFWDITNPLVNKNGIVEVESSGCGCCNHTFLFTPKEYYYFLLRARDRLNFAIEKIKPVFKD